MLNLEVADRVRFKIKRNLRLRGESLVDFRFFQWLSGIFRVKDSSGNPFEERKRLQHLKLKGGQPVAVRYFLR